MPGRLERQSSQRLIKDINSTALLEGRRKTAKAVIEGTKTMGLRDEEEKRLEEMGEQRAICTLLSMNESPLFEDHVRLLSLSEKRYTQRDREIH